ncbi:hypothetical protein Nmel_006541, partial [Mimus melanotis]
RRSRRSRSPRAARAPALPSRRPLPLPRVPSPLPATGPRRRRPPDTSFPPPPSLPSARAAASVTAPAPEPPLASSPSAFSPLRLGNCEPQIVLSEHTQQRDWLTGPPWLTAWKIHLKWEAR